MAEEHIVLPTFWSQRYGLHKLKHSSIFMGLQQIHKVFFTSSQLLLRLPPSYQLDFIIADVSRPLLGADFLRANVLLCQPQRLTTHGCSNLPFRSTSLNQFPRLTSAPSPVLPTQVHTCIDCPHDTNIDTKS